MQAAGLAWIAFTATGNAGYGQFVAPLVLAGVGISMAIPTVPAAALNALPPADVGKASGVQSTLQRFGAVFGVAIVVAVFSANGHLSSPAAVVAGFRPALGAAAGFSLAGALTALATARRHSSGPPAAEQPARVLAAAGR